MIAEYLFALNVINKHLSVNKLRHKHYANSYDFLEYKIHTYLINQKHSQVNYFLFDLSQHRIQIRQYGIYFFSPAFGIATLHWEAPDATVSSAPQKYLLNLLLLTGGKPVFLGQDHGLATVQ
ncbi:MAG: hypothetical protein KGZ83_20950 [Sulfuricella sp.]|nr:hypothetical protein [Sulfuricella sp.]